MKKFVSIVLVLVVMAGVLCGCGSLNKDEELIDDFLSSMIDNGDFEEGVEYTIDESYEADGDDYSYIIVTLTGEDEEVEMLFKVNNEKDLVKLYCKNWLTDNWVYDSKCSVSDMEAYIAGEIE